MEGMRELQPASISVIIADPPYNIGKDFGNDSDKQSLQGYLLWMEQALEEFSRVLKDDGSLFIYGFSEILAHLSVRLENYGLEHRWLIWHYENKNVASVKTWQRSHEGILWAEKRELWAGHKVILTGSRLWVAK